MTIAKKANRLKGVSHTLLLSVRFFPYLLVIAWSPGLTSSLSLNERRKPTIAVTAAMIKETFTPWIMLFTPSVGLAAVDMIVTRTAVPIDPDTCRNVLFIAVPCGIKSLGNWFKAKVVIGIMTMAIEIIRIPFMLARYVNVVCSSRLVNANVVSDNNNSPLLASHFPPNLSKR